MRSALICVCVCLSLSRFPSHLLQLHISLDVSGFAACCFLIISSSFLGNQRYRQLETSLSLTDMLTHTHPHTPTHTHTHPHTHTPTAKSFLQHQRQRWRTSTLRWRSQAPAFRHPPLPPHLSLHCSQKFLLSHAGPTWSGLEEAREH